MANIDFPLNPTVGQRYTFAGVTYVFSAQGVWSPATSISIQDVPQGRLTLQSGVPVMFSSSTGHTALYYTPYVGNRVPIWDGLQVAMRRFDELSTTTVDFTKNPAPIGPNKINDWFIWNDAGTLRLCHGPDWTDDVSRSPGTTLIRIEGLLLNNAAIVNGPAAQRGTYIGTTMSSAASQLDWVYGTRQVPPIAGFFGIWNMYWRAQVSSRVGDATTTWTYSSDVVREINGNTTARHYFVSGIQEDTFTAACWAGGFAANVGTSYVIGVGYDSVTQYSGQVGNAITTGQFNMTNGRFSTSALGKHYFSFLENSAIAGFACTAYGITYKGSEYSGMWLDGRF